MTSRKLQIFRFVLIEMFSPCFLNSFVMSLLFRSDCGPFGPLTKPGSDSRSGFRIGSHSGSDRIGLVSSLSVQNYYLEKSCFNSDTGAQNKK